MKYKLIFVVTFIFFIFTSCKIKNQNVSHVNTDIVISDNKLEIVILDSCEYYYGYWNKEEYVLTHKGNCKNPIHKHLDFSH